MMILLSIVDFKIPNNKMHAMSFATHAYEFHLEWTKIIYWSSSDDRTNLLLIGTDFPV